MLHLNSTDFDFCRDLLLQQFNFKMECIERKPTLKRVEKKRVPNYTIAFKTFKILL